AGHHPASPVDVLDAGPDQLGVAHDRPHDLRALLEIARDPGEQRPDPEQVEGEAGHEQDDVDDRQDDQRGHDDLTFPSTRPRNRWCSRPSARTASTPVATCGISTVLAVLALAAVSVPPIV